MVSQPQSWIAANGVVPRRICTQKSKGGRPVRPHNCPLGQNQRCMMGLGENAVPSFCLGPGKAYIGHWYTRDTRDTSQNAVPGLLHCKLTPTSPRLRVLGGQERSLKLNPPLRSQGWVMITLIACMHLCHSKLCVNPTHLQWGNVQGNSGQACCTSTRGGAHRPRWSSGILRHANCQARILGV
jgi:hypothetical protein